MPGPRNAVWLSVQNVPPSGGSRSPLAESGPVRSWTTPAHFISQYGIYRRVGPGSGSAPYGDSVRATSRAERAGPGAAAAWSARSNRDSGALASSPGRSLAENHLAVVSTGSVATARCGLRSPTRGSRRPDGERSRKRSVGRLGPGLGPLTPGLRRFRGVASWWRPRVVGGPCRPGDRILVRAKRPVSVPSDGPGLAGGVESPSSVPWSVRRGHRPATPIAAHWADFERFAARSGLVRAFTPDRDSSHS
jgi:hypothetical protein